MKIFKVQEGLTSYRYPIVKIISCIALYFLCFFRNKLLLLSNEIIYLCISALCAVCIGPIFYVLYVSLAEIDLIRSARKKNHALHGKGIDISMEHILCLMKENNILEMDIWLRGQVIKIGVSSECEYWEKEFRKKQYYINDVIYFSESSFKSVLENDTEDNMIRVISIDNLPPEFYISK